MFFEFAYEGLCPCVSPDDGVIQRFASMAVPHDGGLALIGDSDGLDGGSRITLGLECSYRIVNAALH